MIFAVIGGIFVAVITVMIWVSRLFVLGLRVSLASTRVVRLVGNAGMALRAALRGAIVFWNGVIVVLKGVRFVFSGAGVFGVIVGVVVYLILLGAASMGVGFLSTSDGVSVGADLLAMDTGTEDVSSDLPEPLAGDNMSKLEYLAGVYLNKKVPNSKGILSGVYDYRVFADFKVGGTPLKARMDCTGFTWGYASLVSGVPFSQHPPGTGSLCGRVADVGVWAVGAMEGSWPEAEANGWVKILTKDMNGLEDLRPGDILVGRGADVARPWVTGHAEVYIGPTSRFGWGDVQKGFPLKADWQFHEGVAGGPQKYITMFRSYRVYFNTVYRYVGK